MIEVMKRAVDGIRRVSENMRRRVELGLEDTGVEAKGFLGEAVDQYADQLDGFATELAQAIGYSPASAELLAAREMAASVLTRMIIRSSTPLTIQLRLGQGVPAVPAASAVDEIVTGRHDDSDIVQDLLLAIERGRELAATGRRAAAAPDRLTITVDGPACSNKTMLGEALRREFPFDYRPLHAAGIHHLDPAIVEIRDGRPFDVRNEEFLDSMAA